MRAFGDEIGDSELAGALRENLEDTNLRTEGRDTKREEPSLSFDCGAVSSSGLGGGLDHRIRFLEDSELCILT